MLHVGMDMHKRFSVVTVTDDSGKEVVKGKRLENDEDEIRSFFCFSYTEIPENEQLNSLKRASGIPGKKRDS